jgi:hypothetical protein
MAYEDSFQITVTSAARRPAITRMPRGEGASRRRAIGNSSLPAVSARHVRNPQSALRGAAKFSALQSLENSQNGETISILREPIPQAGGTPRAEQEGAWAARLAKSKSIGNGAATARKD